MFSSDSLSLSFDRLPQNALSGAQFKRKKKAEEAAKAQAAQAAAVAAQVALNLSNKMLEEKKKAQEEKEEKDRLLAIDAARKAKQLEEEERQREEVRQREQEQQRQREQEQQQRAAAEAEAEVAKLEDMGWQDHHEEQDPPEDSAGVVVDNTGSFKQRFQDMQKRRHGVKLRTSKAVEAAAVPAVVTPSGRVGRAPPDPSAAEPVPVLVAAVAPNAAAYVQSYPTTDPYTGLPLHSTTDPYTGLPLHPPSAPYMGYDAAAYGTVALGTFTHTPHPIPPLPSQTLSLESSIGNPHTFSYTTSQILLRRPHILHRIPIPHIGTPYILQRTRCSAHLTTPHHTTHTNTHESSFTCLSFFNPCKRCCFGCFFENTSFVSRSTIYFFSICTCICICVCISICICISFVFLI